MSTLYVMGNGFDIAHNLKTSYWYFREYLKKYAEDFYIKMEENYGFFQLDVDDYHLGLNPKNTLRERDKIVYNIFWKTIDKGLGFVNESTMLGFSQSIVESLDLESGLVGIQDILDCYWKEQYAFITNLQDYVFKWAKQIRLNKCVPKCSELMNNTSDLFLNFNYTSTLEKIYNIPPLNILHIHGGLPPYCCTKPILGHSNYMEMIKYQKLIKRAQNDFDEASVSIYNAILKFYRDTLKDTKKILLYNNDFFEKLININKIKIIGHSLGKVDHLYFKKIIETVHDDVEWFIYYYKNEEKNTFLERMLELGVNENKLNVLHSNEFWKI